MRYERGADLDVAHEGSITWRSGIRLERAGLRDRHPNATEREIEEMVQAGLEADE